MSHLGRTCGTIKTWLLVLIIHGHSHTTTPVASMPPRDGWTSDLILCHLAMLLKGRASLWSTCSCPVRQSTAEYLPYIFIIHGGSRFTTSPSSTQMYTLSGPLFLSRVFPSFLGRLFASDALTLSALWVFFQQSVYAFARPRIVPKSQIWQSLYLSGSIAFLGLRAFPQLSMYSVLMLKSQPCDPVGGRLCKGDHELTNTHNHDVISWKR